MHQIVGAWGVAAFSAFGILEVFDLLDTLGWHSAMHYGHWVLTQNPYYPVQIGVGLYLGWLLGRRFQQRVMLWVWVIPLIILCYAVVSFTPEWTSVLEAPAASRLSHYFGWQGSIRGHCRDVHCMDQLVLTMPFYAAVAYSIGGWFGLKHPKQKRVGMLAPVSGSR